MYLFDYHVHTARCGHAFGEDYQYVETAIRKGLREIGFSDHIPRFYRPDDPAQKVTERGMPRAELEGYVKSVLKLRDRYPEIAIKLGLEIDYVPGREEQIEAVLGDYPWDYLLGSVHFIPEWNYGYIGYEKEHSPAEIYSAYFSLVARAAESRLFDILGHIDLPRRFFPRLSEEEMRSLDRELAARLGKTGVRVELNTYGVRSSRQGDVGIFPEQYLLRLLHQEGIGVTLGSDAHKPEEVGADFERATQLLKTVGYDRITAFEKRKPKLISWAE